MHQMGRCKDWSSRDGPHLAYYLIFRNTSSCKSCYNFQVHNGPLNIHIMKLDLAGLSEALQDFCINHVYTITIHLGCKDAYIHLNFCL